MDVEIRNIETSILSDHWYVLKKVSYEKRQADGSWKKQAREVYDRGNGAVILLYHKGKGTVVLTRQFRLPTYVNGNETGMLIEACAGLLDQDNAEDAIRREAEEETGYRISHVQKVFEIYMSPGSVTEILYFFMAEYDDSMKVGEGGGLEQEQEDIEVMEIAFSKALAMIGSGEIKDAKTILLLYHAKLHGIL